MHSNSIEDILASTFQDKIFQMKSAIKELGNKIPVSKVICEFHLSTPPPPPPLMSYGTEHLIIQSLGSAAPDNGTKR